MKTKRILSIVLTLAMLLGMLPGMSLTAYAEGNTTEITPTNASGTMNITLTIAAHVHDDITFTAWTATDSMPTAAGNYYLANDVTISNTWNVPSGTTNLCLNGHAIKASGSHGMISVGTGITLNLYDEGEGEHKYTINNGLAVVNDNATGDAVKTFTGGYITGGYVEGQGAAVLVSSGGIFHMYGGTLIGNKAYGGWASFGGAVSVQAGHFEMHDGKIIGNYSMYGAVDTRGGGDGFIMRGGEISYNTATYQGGGVCMGGGGIATISGGKITNNTALGYGEGHSEAGGIVFRSGASKLNISGNPIIKDNAKGDVYLWSGKKLTITGEIGQEASIGITIAPASGNSGYASGVFTNSADTSFNVLGSFFSNSSNYAVGKNSDGQLFLGSPIVTLTYDGNGATGGDVPAQASSYASGSAVTVPGNTNSLVKTGYAFGGWNTKNDGTGTAYAADASLTITADTTLYARWRQAISHTVTFKMVNGSWNDETTTDKTVTLTGYEGDTLKLAAADIPAVGNKPNDTYKAGSWDTTPSVDTEITADTTYTYTYAQKDSISQTVTFKVVNGSWNDETTTDKTVTLTGYEGDALKLAANQIPAVGGKPNDTFKSGGWDTTPSTETEITGAITYTYTYAQKDAISQTVTFKVINGKWDDDTTADKTVNLTGYEGDTLKLAANQIPAVGTKPNDTYKAGSWDVTPSTETAITEATTYTYTYAAKEASVVTKAPEAKTLTYNGSAQELVTAGTATGGTMQYALGTATEATQPYTTSIPTATEAGTYYVWYKVKADENHNDTDANYVEVSIGKRSVTLTSATASKTYDGTALKNSDVTVSGDGFVTGEGATCNVTGSQILPGNTKNTFTYTLNSGTTAGNYEITMIEGTLTVTDRTDEEGDDKKYEITVIANSDEVTYDGTEKSVSGFVQTAFTFNGVTYTVSGLTATAKGTDAGSYTVEVTGTAVVKDAKGNNLTKQFIVSTSNGTLTINKRNVTLTSATASKTYDGNALTDNTVTTSGDGFATGEGATYNVTGSQKVVGSSANAFTYTLNSGTKEANYNITKTEGTLTVTSRDAKYQISPQANSDELKYDGQSHEVTGFETDTFTVEGNTYTVSGLTAAGSGTDAGSYTVSVSGTAVVKDSDGTDVSDQFSVTPQTGTLTINKRRVTMTSATDTKEYDGDALTNTEVTVTGDGFITGEGADYDVTGTRTVVGVSENTFTYTLKDNTKADNYDITTSYGTLTINNRNTKYEVTLTANSGTEKYDGKEKTVSGYTIDGNAGEGTGESAVTSFTASNGKIYTVTGMSAEVTGTNAGEYAVNVIGTPIVKDVDGNDVTTQFAVSSESGKLTIDKRSVTLTSATDTKVYDGKALSNDEITVSEDGFVTGEGVTYNVTGTQTLPGNSKNTFDYTLKSGTTAGNYEITMIEGTLTVTDRTDEEGDDKKYEITVTANSDEVTYDGTEHSVSGFVQTAFTFNGVTYTVSGLSATAKGTDAGSYTVEVTGTAVVKDSKNNDLTKQFIVSTSNGTLTINKRNVTLTSATASKTYDGNALTDNTVTTSGDGFATGEGATYNVTGSQKVVGSSANAFAYTLNEGTKEANYNITKTEGTLTVTSRDAKYQISPQANSDEVKYDGQSHEVTGFETDTFTVEGNTYTVSGLTAAGSGTDAGSYTVSVSGTAVVKDSDGTDVSDEFAVTPQTGTLTINKRSVTLTSASDEKEYDGDALTNDEVTVTGDGFVTGEGATYDVTGTRTLVGSSENAFTYTLNEGTKADNYDITPSYGTLTVTNRNTKYEVTLKANSGTEKYDGSEKTVSGYTIDGTAGEGTGESVVTSFTASNGKTYTVTGMSAEVTGTNAGEYAVNVIGTPIVKDADGNDVTAQFAVSSESGKLTIDKRSVTLTSATDTKVYDGKALSNDEITVSEDGFAEGEGATYDVTGSQTLAGESANAFTYALNEGTIADNYDITTVEGKLTVTKSDSSGEVTAVSGLVYDGKAKALVTAGKTEGGTLMYRLGADGKWQQDILEATDARTYKIYYYIKGDDNHKDDGSEKEPKGSVETTIKKAAQDKPVETFAVAEASDDKTADGKISGFDKTKTYQYSADDGKTWTDVKTGSTEIAVKSGTYQIRYAEDKNHEAGKAASVTVTAKAAPSPEPKITYSNTAGAGSVWTLGSTGTLSFTFSRSENDSETIKHFAGAKVDGKELGSNDYSFKPGSVVIDLKADYLNKLSVGKHTLTAMFDDGDDVTVEFTIKEKASEGGKKSDTTPDNKKSDATSGNKKAAKNDAPGTGDTVNIQLIFLVMILSMCDIFALCNLRSILEKKKRRR